MAPDGGFSATGYCRSPISHRIYLVNNGFVVGEVPPEWESLVPRDQVRDELHAEVELEYLRRKTGNLVRYKSDLDQLRQPELGARLPLRSAADFRIAGLILRHLAAAPVHPRLVQLGNLGCYTYAHAGWRYVLKPGPHELEALKQIPVPRLVADAGVPLFVQRERSEVLGEMYDARELAERLHPEGAGAPGAV
jgi:hypothetical protein